MEFPAGLVDAGETLEECAMRELAEETGYSGRIKVWNLIGPTSHTKSTQVAALSFAVVCWSRGTW